MAEMTSRERVNMAIHRQCPDRLPFNFWMDRDKMAELDKKWGADFRITHYGADVLETFTPLPFFAEFAHRQETKNDGKTVWVTKHLADSITELKNSPPPDAAELSYYKLIRNDRERYPDIALFTLLQTPLEILFGAVGLEQLFYDLMEEPEIMDELCAMIGGTQQKAVDYIADCDVDVLYLAGDICSSQGQMISQENLRRFCFEPVKGVIKRAHERVLTVFYHTDGHVMSILPLFAEYGIDGINPYQANANNDLEVFRDSYKEKLMLYGGIDNCFTVPDGTPEEVRAHIRRLFRTVGADGGLVASSHDIPSKTPMENLDAMVAEIKKCIYN